MASTLFFLNGLLQHSCLSKRAKFRIVLTKRFRSNFTSMWYKHFYWVHGETLDFQYSINNGSGKKVANILQNWFSSRIFYVTISNAHIGSLNSLHTLFDKYFLPYAVEIVWSELYKILSFLTKNGYPFWQSIDTILEDVTQTIVLGWTYYLKNILFQCGK